MKWIAIKQKPCCYRMGLNHPVNSTPKPLNVNTRDEASSRPWPKQLNIKAISIYKMEYENSYHRQKGTLLQQWISVILRWAVAMTWKQTNRTKHTIKERNTSEKHGTTNFITPPSLKKRKKELPLIRESVSVCAERIEVVLQNTTHRMNGLEGRGGGWST